MLYGPTLILLEDSFHFEEEVGLQECLIRAVVRPDAREAGAVTVAKPVGDLLDGGLLEIVGGAGWAGSGVSAGKTLPSLVVMGGGRGVDGEWWLVDSYQVEVE